MSLENKWEKALNNTEIKRQRLQSLHTFKTTELHYILLGESTVNLGDTVVRKGKISVDKPMLVLPHNYPQFKGFDFKQGMETNSEDVRTFLLMRGIKFPSLEYNNELYSLDIIEKPLQETLKEYLNKLERKEDVKTGLLAGPEDCWQFSLIIYVATLIVKSTGPDMKNIIEKIRRDNN